jgi:glycosyltransferase involved in cell wall biosynthesis
MSSPTVTIIIPFYNAASALHEYLGSAINQSWRDIKIRCIDDSPRDSSFTILSAYFGEDTRVRIIQHYTNRGVGDARNTEIDSTRGEYVFHPDADDSILLNALKELYSIASTAVSEIAKGHFFQIYHNDAIGTFSWSSHNMRSVNTILLYWQAESAKQVNMRAIYR